MPALKKYCLDSSALINPWTKHYPIDVFGPVWDKLDEWIRAGRILLPEEVYLELGKQDDDLFGWVKERKDGMLIPTDEEVLITGSEVLRRFRELAKQSKGRHAADPWVIAVARLNDATVVSEESRGRGAKIPNVCEEYGVPHTNFLGLIKAMRVRFS